MNVIKCDRCGAVYEENPIVAMDGRQVVGTVFISVRNTDVKTDVKLDLCEKCLVELLQFMGLTLRIARKVETELL